jgi:hypothetical protein
VLCNIVCVQVACLQGSVVSACLEQLADSSPDLRQWLALCLGKVVMFFNFRLKKKNFLIEILPQADCATNKHGCGKG